MDGWCVTNAADRSWMRSRLAPQPLAALREPLEAHGETTARRSYLHCLRGPTVAIFERLAERARADPDRWAVRQLTPAMTP